MNARADRIATIVAVLLALAAPLAAPLRAEPPLAPAPAPPAEAPTAAAAPVLPDPPIPTQHANQAGIGRCAPAVDQLARLALTNPYNAQSTWHQASPADHVFQSVAGVRNPRSGQPGGMVAIVAAPVPGEACDAVAMEVYPLAGTCADVRKAVLKGGENETLLEDLHVITDAQKRRLMLLPGAANTCIAISVNSFYAK